MKKRQFVSLRAVVAIILLFAALTCSVGCAAKKVDNKNVEVSPETLNGKPVAILVGSVYDTYATKYLPDSQHKMFNSIADAILALMANKVDCIIIDEPVARLTVAQTPELAYLPKLLSRDEYAFAFAKNSKADGIRKELDAFITEKKNDGTLKEMQDCWFGTDESKKQMKVKDYTALPATNGTINYATANTFQPFSYLRDGEYVGYELDLFTRFCEEAGYAVNISITEFSSLIPGISSGKYDLCGECLTITEERKESVNFSQATYVGGVAILYRRTGNEPISPDKARIGSLTGSVCEEVAIKNNPNAEYSGFASFPDCAVALKSNQLDYVALPETNAVNYVREDPCYEIYGQAMDTTHINIGVTKSKPELLGKIDALISKYREDGTLDRIYSNWMRPDGSEYVLEDIPQRTEGEVLRVATSLTMEPTGFVLNNKPAGYDMDIAKLLAYDLNMQIEIIDENFNALIPTIQGNKADIIVSFMVATEERMEQVNFSQTYFDVGIVLMRYNEKKEVKVNIIQSITESIEKNFIREQRWKIVLSGIGITLLISICAGILGLIIGFLICSMRGSNVKVLSLIAKVFIRILQGTPIVVLLMILYYVVFNKSGLDGITVAIIAFGFNFGAYAAEILRTGINAVDRGQSEAAAAAGFNKNQAFWLIIMPQAARHFLPVLKGEFISLVKMTSVVGYVAVQDLTKASDIVRSRTYEAFFPLIVTALIYFLLSWGLSSLLSLIEVRVDPKRRKLKNYRLPQGEAEEKGAIEQ